VSFYAFQDSFFLRSSQGQIISGLQSRTMVEKSPGEFMHGFKAYTFTPLLYEVGSISLFLEVTYTKEVK
jgi:hypothetical protein